MNGSLAQAAVWPDQIRKTLPQFDRLHYVDVPRGARAYDRNRDCPQRNCVVEAISWFSRVLGSREAPLAEKQIALSYLVHLVGDLHQPLHIGFLDDAGGTKTLVTFRGKQQKVHQLWDSGILQIEQGSADELAVRLDQEFR